MKKDDTGKAILFNMTKSLFQIFNQIIRIFQANIHPDELMLFVIQIILLLFYRCNNREHQAFVATP